MGVKRPTYEQLGEMVEKFRGELQKRTQAEEELRESEQRHRLIFENAADGILLADRETKKFYMGNKQICEALGYSPEEIKKLKIRDIHPEEDLPYVFDQFEKLARNEISVAKDIPVKRKDGSVYYADISGFGQVLGEKACLIGVFRDITSRKKAEEALRQSEEKTRSIFRVAPVGIGVVRDRILEDVNFLICEMTGYSKEELVGNSARMLYPTQQDFDYVGTEKYRQIAERGIGIVETRWIKKDGNIIDILLASTPMDINDYSKGITFTALDITERKRAEEVLRQSELSYRTIFDSATDAIFLHDAETGRILEVNEAACHLWGYSREEFQASTLGMVSSGIPPYTQKEAMEWVRRAVKEGPQSFYWIAKRRDGTPIWLENSLKHIDIGGEERVLVVGRDITDRKRAEEETKRLAHENAIIAAIGRIVSSTLNIEEVYERFAEEVKKLILFDRIGISTFDLKHERVTIGYVSGQDIPDRRPGDHIPLAGSVMEELLKRRSSILLQTEKEEEWGECFPALLSTFQSGIRSMLAVPLFSKDQVIGMLHLQSLAPKAYTEEDLKLAEKVSNQIAGAIANAQLFTQHERSEAEKVNLQAQLQQSQKMEAIGRLAGGIAHDFNNLLTVISVQSQLALRGLKEGDPLTEKLKDIEKAADRAANLTRQLLAFSRRQILEMKVINLNIILTDIEKMLIRVIGEDIELKTILADELGMVKVDPGQMEQVIVNLAVNAKDAMPKGGKLLLETANAELDEEYTRSH
ncbi:MAG TPA: PAS domain S-box protein, partial [Thermodesulfobacteriota bacterium]|nr:PAS domain S-box protein [Thermodesulfobacteriota bacterium]